MNDRRGRAFALLVLGVVAAAALAGSFAASEPLQRGSGEGTGSGGPSTGENEDRPAAGVAPQLVPASWIQSFAAVALTLGMVFLLATAVAVTWLDGLDGLKRLLAIVGDAVGGLVTYVLVVGFLVFLVFGFTGSGISGIPTGEPDPVAGGSGGSGEGVVSTGQQVPTWAVVIAALLVLSVGAALLVRAAGNRDDDGGGTTSTVAAPGGSGSTDGPAVDVPAEGIEDVPPSNGVYRAWRRLADRVDEATDRTLTTGEVADAARDRGMDPEAVGTLTRQFEAVRYGDRAPTADRERRAEAALDAVEAGDGGER